MALEHIDTNQPYITRTRLEARLREAGVVLVSLPERRGPDGHRGAWPGIVHSVREAYNYTPEKNRFAEPNKKAVDEMFETLDWVLLLKPGHERYIVTARMLWHPLQDKPFISWRQLSRKTGLHRDTVRRYWDVALDRMIARINAPEK